MSKISADFVLSSETLYCRCLLFTQLSVTITGVTSGSQSREVHALYTLSNFRHGGDHVSAKRSVAKDVRGSVSRPKTPVNLDMFYSWTFRPILPPIAYSVRSFTAWARSLFRNICCITIISIVQSQSVSPSALRIGFCINQPPKTRERSLSERTNVWSINLSEKCRNLALTLTTKNIQHTLVN